MENLTAVTVQRHGVTVGKAGSGGLLDHDRGGARTGWTASSARGNLKFLRSVDPACIGGEAWAITLTISTVKPITGEQWKKLREALLARLRRAGVVRFHWVTEWTRRGVPHLHMWVEGVRGNLVVRHWLDLTEDWETLPSGQSAQKVYSAIGWFKYSAKHSSRGIHHYQRQAPDGWQGQIGRVWGRGGAWVLVDPEKLLLCPCHEPILLRQLRRFAKLRATKRMSVWIDQATTERLLDWVNQYPCFCVPMSV